MNQRKPASGRPSGTDGSDYSYRMVVDSRYQKVAKGKSRLYALFLTQVIIQLGGVVSSFMSISKKGAPDNLAISSLVIGFISLLIGESGRRFSRASFLKGYIIGSSVALLLCFASVFKGKLVLEVIQDLSNWETGKAEIFWNAFILLGVLHYVITLGIILSLISNMSPPKRAS